ncbi:MAG: DNA mismatch repair endonuclease MutL [Prevotellaceae bacterium]|jgi:DNA mismatch repair protein MutL|nr:DNA mismatch repair endonuclease MutL [Prevotellaceae bacterium]
MIQVLPESVANQIAAGEVIQRPASVVKELVENAIDAKASLINVIIKDAGRTLIQIIDNGIGMSETDARLAFERHATSKIKNADDLFAIQTFGFRGEALASIASIAEVELKTRREDDEIGTQICIYASTVTAQNPIASPVGSAFSIKNLFFNVPARRKFLKSDNVELKHIITEFQRVALGHPEVGFTLVNNGTEIYNLPKSNLRQRIVGLFGKSINSNLIDVNVETSVVKIYGFVGKPECVKKSQGEQFFYVNNRFFKSPYFQKAVYNAYDQLVPQGSYLSFFLCFDIDPSRIDVNIHPTKVEIKFEEEQTIWQVINAAIRESIGKFALAPTIDFDTEGAIDIPISRPGIDVNAPSVAIDHTYNPFDEEEKRSSFNISSSYKKDKVPSGWEQLYQGLDGFIANFDESLLPNNTTLFSENEIKLDKTFIQLKGEYILTPVKSGLMIIDQRRAHQRILYEQLLENISHAEGISQIELFPQHIELAPADYILLNDILEDLQELGFDIRDMGRNSVVVYALPSSVSSEDPMQIVQDIVNDLAESGTISSEKRKEQLAISLAEAAAIGPNRMLSQEEMSELTGKLFSCKTPNVSPKGKPTLITLEIEEIAKRLLK